MPDVTKKAINATETGASVKKDDALQSKPSSVNSVKEKEDFWGKDKKASPWRKWAKRLLSVIGLTLATSCLITFSLYKLTAPEPAKATMRKVLTVILTRMATPENSQKLDVNRLIRSVEESTKQIPDLKINLNTKELSQLTPEAAIDSISIQVSEAIYEQQDVVTLPKNAGQIFPMEFNADSSRSLQFFNRATHETLSDRLKIIAAIAITALALLALVSQGGSRLSAPGWIILISSLPIFLILTFSSDIIAKLFEQFNTQEFAAQVAQVVSDFIPSLVEVVRPIYLAGTIFGAVLVIVGILLGIAFRPKPAEVS